MKTIKVKLTGKCPLLMHSDKFANPLDPLTKAHKELTQKRTKTDDDHIAIARSEFIGGCYWNKEAGFHIPAVNFEACLVEASKLQKLGKKFKQGVMVMDNELPLEGVKAKSPEVLWEDADFRDVRGVKVSSARLMRYRPIFRTWATTATIAFDDAVVNLADIKKALLDAGALIGLGDYRPRMGRFAVDFV